MVKGQLGSFGTRMLSDLLFVHSYQLCLDSRDAEWTGMHARWMEMLLTITARADPNNRLTSFMNITITKYTEYYHRSNTDSVPLSPVASGLLAKKKCINVTFSIL